MLLVFYRGNCFIPKNKPVVVGLEGQGEFVIGIERRWGKQGKGKGMKRTGGEWGKGSEGKSKEKG